MDRTYAAIIRRAMSEQGLSVRDLERKTGFSYEHVRKCIGGMPHVGPDFNKALCATLGLNESEMWAVAFTGKFKNRARSFGLEVGSRFEKSERAPAETGLASNVSLEVTPSGTSRTELLGKKLQRLTQAEQDRLYRIVDGWLAAREG